MADSRHIARILGPTLIALSASETANPRIWAGVSATQVYLAGALWFVAGLSIVCTHNRWPGGLPALVTFMGWFAVVGGLFRMFAPEVAQGSVPSPTVLLAIQAVLLAIGAFLEMAPPQARRFKTTLQTRNAGGIRSWLHHTPDRG